MDTLLMDKRIALGRNKYKYVHTALLEEGYELLSQIKFGDFNLKKLADYSKYSLTTVYEHFESSTEVFFIEFIEHLRNKGIKEYRQLYTHNEKENIIIMFTKFSEFMTNEFLLWTNLKAARILLGDKKVNPFFLIEELLFQAEVINLKPDLAKKITDLFYAYENTFLENSSNRSELTGKFIDELSHTLN